jgi:hypothetical protein
MMRAPPKGSSVSASMSAPLTSAIGVIVGEGVGVVVGGTGVGEAVEGADVDVAAGASDTGAAAGTTHPTKTTMSNVTPITSFGNFLRLIFPSLRGGLERSRYPRAGLAK